MAHFFDHSKAHSMPSLKMALLSGAVSMAPTEKRVAEKEVLIVSTLSTKAPGMMVLVLLMVML